jgi:hypothetical protein
MLELQTFLAKTDMAEMIVTQTMLLSKMASLLLSDTLLRRIYP